MSSPAGCASSLRTFVADPNARCDRSRKRTRGRSTRPPGWSTRATVSGRRCAADLHRSTSCGPQWRRAGTRGTSGRRPPRSGRRCAGIRTSNRRCRPAPCTGRALRTRIPAAMNEPIAPASVMPSCSNWPVVDSLYDSTRSRSTRRTAGRAASRSSPSGRVIHAERACLVGDDRDDALAETVLLH